LTNKDIFSISLNEESRIGFAHLKTILEKKILKAFIPCSRCLYTWFGNFESSKPGGLKDRYGEPERGE
jgi:hypothetical protein